MCIFTITREKLKAEKFSDVETMKVSSTSNEELDLLLISVLKKIAA